MYKANSKGYKLGNVTKVYISPFGVCEKHLTVGLCKKLKFVKKPDLAVQLINKCLGRGYRLRVTVIDAGYGNNTASLKQLESRNLTYKV